MALWDLRNLKLKLHSLESHKDEIFQVGKLLTTCRKKNQEEYWIGQEHVDLCFLQHKWICWTKSHYVDSYRQYHVVYFYLFPLDFESSSQQLTDKKMLGVHKYLKYKVYLK